VNFSDGKIETEHYTNDYCELTTHLYYSQTQLSQYTPHVIHFKTRRRGVARLIGDRFPNNVPTNVGDKNVVTDMWEQAEMRERRVIHLEDAAGSVSPNYT